MLINLIVILFIIGNPAELTADAPPPRAAATAAMASKGGSGSGSRRSKVGKCET